MKLGDSHRTAAYRSIARATAICLALLLIASGACFAQQKSLPMATGERPLNWRVKMFEASDRDQWQKPEQVMKPSTSSRG